MQIVCPACSKRLQIPDEKLPTDRQVRLACPSCQERFIFDPSAAPAADDAPIDTAPEPTPQPPATPITARPPAPTPVPRVDIADAGAAPRALVCLDHAAHREACQEMLPSFGYQTVHVMSQHAEALGYLNEVSYEFSILDATFDGSTLEANPVLAALRALPMHQRRYMFIALCLPNATSNDDLAAYSHGVNLVINPVDLPDCRRPLERHLEEHKRLYRVYRELRQKLGKDI